jgi:pyrroline-5-carboxylate reductase
MIVGFCGSGSRAAAMGRGWAGRAAMLFTDSGSGRAAELAAEVGGEAVASNAELAARADLVVLAVKPAALDAAAAELDAAKAVVSLLGATSLERLRQACPGAVVTRVMPNVAAEVGRGVLCVTGDPDDDVRALLAELGVLVDLPDEQFDAATAVMGCAPAYLALAIEAIAEAGAEAGLDATLSHELVVDTAAGTAELLRNRSAAEVRRAVASPGGSTEAGLRALDAEGARAAFEAAVRASLERMKGS